MKMNSPARGVYETPTMIIDTEGYVFLRGNSNIGVGTRGIGERGENNYDESSSINNTGTSPTRAQTSPTASSWGIAGSPTQQLKDRRIKEYIKERTALHKEWKAKEEASVQAKLAEQQNARLHMHMVMMQHREEVAKMGRERKQQEDAAKEERAKIARERNAIFHEQKEKAVKEKEEAKRQREIQKVYDAEALRKKKEELKVIDRAEREVMAEEAKRRIEYLQEIAKEDRKRMYESKQKRHIDLQDSVHSLKVEQKERVHKRDHTMHEIVQLKSELIQEVKTKIVTEHQRIFYERLEQAHYNAVKTRQEEKELEKQREKRRQERIEEAKEAAAKRKEEAEIRMNAYLESRDKAKSLLQLQAREQKQRAKRAIEQENSERYKETQSYIRSCRELAQRRVTSDMIKIDDSKHRRPTKSKNLPTEAELAAQAEKDRKESEGQMW